MAAAAPAGAGSLPFLYSDFTGGLNTLDAPYLLTDNQARDLSNVQGTTAGAIVKRNGLATHATPGSTLSSLFALESVSPMVLVGAGGTSLYSVAAAGPVTQIASGLANNRRWEFVSAPVIAGQGPLYGMNGIDPPQQWAGSGLTGAWVASSGGQPVPNGKYCVYVQNQVFVSGVAGQPSRVYWSAIADPTNWDPASLTGAGFVDLDPNDGHAITALGTVGPYVLVAKPRKLWVIISTATPQVRQLSDSVGVIAHRSVAEGAEGTYFLAEDRGVYVTNGSKVTPLSDVIQPTLDGIQPGLRSQAAGAYFDAHYYLSVPTQGGANDTTLDFDARLNSWWKHSFGSNQFAVWHPNGPSQLYSAKSTAAFVDRCFAPNVYQDNGTPFTWIWRGPWQSPTFYRRRRFPTPYFRKRLRQIRYDGFGQVDFSLGRDFLPNETLMASDIFNYRNNIATFGGTGTFGPDVYGSSSTYGGAGTFGGQSETFFGAPPSYARGRMYTLGVNNAWSVVFSGTNNSPATLVSYVLMVTDRRDLVNT